MSGHSKWHSIRHKKAAVDAKRANAFTKLAKNITVAARQGGGDPEMNFSLRVAIEKAKQANMPKDNIEKAIKRGTGEIEGGEITEAVYEGFGPGKVGMIITSLTDNTNRALTDIKTIMNKNGGEMAGKGSVSWNFDKKGVIYIETEKLEGKDWDELELELIDAGASDVKKEDDIITIYTEVEDYGKMMKKLEDLNITPQDSGLEYVPKNTKKLSSEEEEKLMNLIELLEDNDDVDQVFHEAE